MARGTFMTGQNRQWWRSETTTGDAIKDAAQNLALMARRYINERASVRDVEEAIELWRATQPSPSAGDTGKDGT